MKHLDSAYHKIIRGGPTQYNLTIKKNIPSKIKIMQRYSSWGLDLMIIYIIKVTGKTPYYFKASLLMFPPPVFCDVKAVIMMSDVAYSRHVHTRVLPLCHVSLVTCGVKCNIVSQHQCIPRGLSSPCFKF